MRGFEGSAAFLFENIQSTPWCGQPPPPVTAALAFWHRQPPTSASMCLEAHEARKRASYGQISAEVSAMVVAACSPLERIGLLRGPSTRLVGVDAAGRQRAALVHRADLGQHAVLKRPAICD